MCSYVGIIGRSMFYQLVQHGELGFGYSVHLLAFVHHISKIAEHDSEINEKSIKTKVIDHSSHGSNPNNSSRKFFHINKPSF
jgi:hypothetical protein